MSRAQAFQSRGEDIPLPYIREESYYLVTLLDEVGATNHSAMGMAPLSWQELLSWYGLSNLSLSYWELSLIRELSYNYTAELSNASDVERRAPYSAPVPERVVNVDEKIRSMFSGMRIKK